MNNLVDTTTKAHEIRRALVFPDIREFDWGYEVGYAWAQDEGESEQIVRALAAAVQPGFSDLLIEWERDAFGPAVNLANLILNDGEGFDRRAGEVFWGALDDDIDNVYGICTFHFLEGFASAVQCYVDECLAFKR